METNTHQFLLTGGFDIDANLEPIRDCLGDIVGFKRPDGITVKLVVSLEEMSPDELKVNYRTTESEMEKLGFSSLDYTDLVFGEAGQSVFDILRK